MSRLIFEAGRREPGPKTRTGAIVIEAPPELARVVPPSLLRRALPFLIVFLIVGMIVAMVATGMRLISPQTLFFPFVMLLAATALYRGGGTGVRTEEIDAERADYLRYLSSIRDSVRAAAAAQRAALLWSHPDPAALAVIPGSRRQWERDPGDRDFLVLRVGLHTVALDTSLRVADTADEVDLEPVSHSALRALLDTQRTVGDAPRGIDLKAVSRITVIGQACEVRAAVRAWLCQAVSWHDAASLGVALASPDLESPDWSWLKWLPHTDITGRFDGCGPARYLATGTDELIASLGPMLAQRPLFGDDADVPLRHLLIVVDDPGLQPPDSVLAAGMAAVTMIHTATADSEPRPGQHPDPERPVLRILDGAIQRWEIDGWRPYVAAADRMSPAEAVHLARGLSRWDSNPTHTGLRSPATRGAGFTTLMGISDASALDLGQLWAPRSRDDELRVPIGITATGEPLYFDLKDEAEGGMGPHGLMIGMTGSGKSQTLMSILLSLLTTHSAERLIVIYVDFKGEAGADIFRNFPQVVAVISNMAEKKSLADRFADTLRGEVARREDLLREAGRLVQGSAFGSVAEYEAARPAAEAAGVELPPLPTLFVVADEFTLMLAEHPEYAELFDYVARKGRSFRIHILFASQTLDIGRIRDIDKNTSYRIGLKVASAAASRQVIGVEDAYHIESGREHKGIGFLVPAPGAAPVKFRSTYVDGIYDPPRAAVSYATPATPEPVHFIASPTIPADAPVLAPEADAVPAVLPRKLITTIGDQLALYGPKAPVLWLPPLDEPIPLSAMVTGAAVTPGHRRWPLGEIDRPFQMRRDPLIFDAMSAAGNLVIHGGAKSGKSTALMTFVLSAAALHSPREVTFYCLDYGGGRLRELADLNHVGSVAGPLDHERIRRTFGELEQLLAARRRAAAAGAVHRDSYGEVFLVIDNLYAFGRDNTDQFNTRNPLLAVVTELANTGLAHGIHVVVTTSNWHEVPLAMRDGLGMRLELRLPDPRESNVRIADSLRRPAESVPYDQPGRGLTMAGEHFLFAEPDAAQIPVLNAAHSGVQAPPVRLLPADLAPTEVAPTYRGGERVVLGRRELDLAPVVHDFAEQPLLMVFGDSKSGKTTLLRHLIRTVRDNVTPADVAFTVFDRRLHLVGEPLFADNEYSADVDRVTPAVLGLTALVEGRRPPAGLSGGELATWNYRTRPGPAHTHYLIVDDVDQIPDGPAMSGPYAGHRPWTPLLGLLSAASDLGLRVIVTGRAGGSAHALMTNPLLRRMGDLQATVLMLAGNPADGGKIRGHRFSRLPAGRGLLLGDRADPERIQLVNPDLENKADAHSARTRPGQEYPS